MTNPIAQELTELAARDQRMRAKLLAAGVLHDGYHPQMEAVHRDNAEHLEAIILPWDGRPRHWLEQTPRRQHG